MLSEIEQVEMLIALGRGDKYRLVHIRETLESGKELFISDKNFLHNLVKTNLKDRIYHARVVSAQDIPSQSCEKCGSAISPDEKFCTNCGTSKELTHTPTVDTSEFTSEPETERPIKLGKPQTSEGFTFTNDGEIDESSTIKDVQRKPTIKSKPSPESKKKSRDQKLAEYESEYLNKSEAKVIWKAYDVKAKRKVEIQNPKVIKMKNGKWAIKGMSPITGIKVFRIVGMKKPDLSGEQTTESPKEEKEVVSRYYKSHEDNDPKPKKSKPKKSKSDNCSNCFSKIAADDMFCTNCGAKR